MSGFKLVEGCRYGRFLVPPADAYVGRALEEYGEYSQLELDLLLQFIVEGQTRVVVAGANFGALIPPLARKAAEVVAFEPQRVMFQLLSANVVLNDLVNVRTYWGGLGNVPEKIRVPMLSPFETNNFGGYELEMGRGGPGDAVPIYPLDVAPDCDCGLLTIDVEGMEAQVLAGAERMVGRCRPLIFFEADRKLKRAESFSWLRKRQYDLYWYRTPLFNPDNWRGKAEDVWRGPAGEVVVAENVVAVPKEKNLKLNGFIPVLE